MGKTGPMMARTGFMLGNSGSSSHFSGPTYRLVGKPCDSQYWEWFSLLPDG